MNSQDLVLLCVKAAIDKKAQHSLIYDVGRLGAFTDYFLITSGSSNRQAQAVADEICRMARDQDIERPRVEGYDDGRWILVDFGDVVIHVFQEYIREFYDLESLWAAAPRLSIPQEYYTTPPAPHSPTVHG